MNYKKINNTEVERHYFIAKALYRTGASKTGLMQSLATDCGTRVESCCDKR